MTTVTKSKELDNKDLQHIEAGLEDIKKGRVSALKDVARRLEESFLEPELRPEYIEKLNLIRKGKYTKFCSVDELRKATKADELSNEDLKQIEAGLEDLKKGRISSSKNVAKRLKIAI